MHRIGLAGYETIQSPHDTGEERRGGVSVFIRHHLWTDISDIRCIKDQIWFSLQDTRFGAVYIPPNDSAFFTPLSFSSIQEECINANKIIIMGDLNARLGQLQEFARGNQNTKFADNVDTICNSHGRNIKMICRDFNLLPLNHMIFNRKRFEGQLTFRRRDVWISQLDWTLCSTSVLPDIEHFSIDQRLDLPSDHAPMSVMWKVCLDLDTTLQNSMTLGTYSLDSSKHKSKPTVCSIKRVPPW